MVASAKRAAAGWLPSSLPSPSTYPAAPPPDAVLGTGCKLQMALDCNAPESDSSLDEPNVQQNIGQTGQPKHGKGGCISQP